MKAILVIKVVAVSCDSPVNPIHFAGYNLVDNGEAGVPVKALYDYETVEISYDSPFNSIHVQDTTWWIMERRGFL